MSSTTARPSDTLAARPFPRPRFRLSRAICPGTPKARWGSETVRLPRFASLALVGSRWFGVTCIARALDGLDGADRTRSPRGNPYAQKDGHQGEGDHDDNRYGVDEQREGDVVARSCDLLDGRRERAENSCGATEADRDADGRSYRGYDHRFKDDGSADLPPRRSDGGEQAELLVLSAIEDGEGVVYERNAGDHDDRCEYGGEAVERRPDRSIVGDARIAQERRVESRKVSPRAPFR